MLATISSVMVYTAPDFKDGIANDENPPINSIEAPLAGSHSKTPGTLLSGSSGKKNHPLIS